MRMPPKIKSISIHAFRGIPDLELELAGKSLLLKGENATGKSSVVEAFEFFFTGKLSAFEGEGTQNLSLQKHAPHKNFNKNDVAIIVAFKPRSVTLERTFANQPAPPKQLEGYFEEARTGTFILRRSQILKFIASVPADRFRAIASLIGIERLDKIELAMKRAYEELDGNVHSKQERVQSTFKIISEILNRKVVKSKQVLNLVNRKLKEINLLELTSFDEVDRITEETLKTFKKSADFEHATRLHEIVEELRLLRVDEEITRNLHDLKKKMKPFLAEKVKKELSLTEFLVKGRQTVAEYERNICPLCMQEVDRQELLKQINERLQTLKQLSEETSEIRRISMNVEGKLILLIDNVERQIPKLELFKSLDNLRIKLRNNLTDLKKLIGTLKSAKEFREDISVEMFEQKKTELENLIKSLSTKCQVMLERIGVPEDWKSKVKVISLVNQIKPLITEITRTKEDLKTEEKQRELTRIVYNTFSEVKKAKINEVYNSITGNVNAFYYMLHPKDPHKNVELSVLHDRRASTELKIESFGSKEDPRAFSSEGHLDSLGLCIFLAFMKKFNRSCTFIVLDDVVTTIDAQHRELICDLLFEQFKDYQLFITTHDTLWYEQLCAHQRAFRIEGNFKNMEIIRWTLENGPMVEPYKTRWDKIENRIKSGDKTGAASEGRRCLEWLLKRICERIMAKPIFKTSGYTVSDLFTPVRRRIEELVKDAQFKEKVLKIFQELEATVIMGNLLVHDNPETENASMEEVKHFCKAIHELHNVFTCPECETFLKYYQDMKRIRCPNPHCKQQIEIICK
jgi:hypothetical protein